MSWLLAAALHFAASALAIDLRTEWSSFDGPEPRVEEIDHLDVPVFPHPDGKGVVLFQEHITLVKNDGSVEILGPAGEGLPVGFDSMKRAVVLQFAPNRLVVTKFDLSGRKDGVSRSIAVVGTWTRESIRAHLATDDSLVVLLNWNSELVPQQLLKINAKGDRLWILERPAGSGPKDVATALAVGADGFVYLAGTAEFGSDLAGSIAVKVSPTGTIEWKRTTYTPGPLQARPAGFSGGAINSKGHFVLSFVSGYEWGEPDSSGTLSVLPPSLVTIHYRPDGSAAWTNRFAHALSAYGIPVVTADHEGNAYVAASLVEKREDWLDYSSPPTRTLLIKYSAEGHEIWARVGEAIPNTTPEPKTAWILSNGDILLSLLFPRNNFYTDGGLARYTPTGEPLGTLQITGGRENVLSVRCCPYYGPPLASESGDGATLVTAMSAVQSSPGSPIQNIPIVRRVDRNLRTEWQTPVADRSWTQITRFDMAVAADPEGNSYSIGAYREAQQPWLVTRHDVQGQRTWSTSLAARPELRSATLKDILIAGSDRLHLLFTSSNGWTTATLDSSGQEIATTQHLGHNEFSPEPTFLPLGLARGPGDSVIVAALLQRLGVLDTLEWVILNREGIPTSTNSFPTSAEIANFIPISFTTDNDGNLLVAGSPQVNGVPPMKALVKLGIAGDIHWFAPLDIYANLIVAGPNNTAYVTQSSVDLETVVVTTVKINSLGKAVWTNRVNMAFSSSRTPSLLQTHRGGLVVVDDPSERAALQASKLLFLYSPETTSRIGLQRALIPSLSLFESPAMLWWLTDRSLLIVGSNPSSASFTRLLTLQTAVRRSSSGVRIEWLLEPGVAYRIQSAPDLEGPWTEAGEMTTDFLGEATYLNPSTPAQRIFYRAMR